MVLRALVLYTEECLKSRWLVSSSTFSLNIYIFQALINGGGQEKGMRSGTLSPAVHYS